MNRKLIVYLVSLSAFMAPFTQNVYTPILPEITRDFNTSTFTVNLTISLYTFFLAVMQMVYGPLTDSKGRRNIILIGLSVYILGSVGCSLSTSIYMLLVFRSVQAIGIAAGSVVAITVIGDLFEGKERGAAMGVFQMMVALGPVVGPVIGGFLAGAFDFHSIFLFLAGVGVLVLVGHMAILRETKPEQVRSSHFKPRDFMAVLQNPIGSSVIFLGFVQFYAYYNFIVFLPNILSKTYGLSVEQKGLALLPMTVFIVAGSFLGGKTQEKLKEKNVILFTSCFIIAAILFYMFTALHSLILLQIGLAAFGLFLGVSQPVQTTILTQVYQANRATAAGAYNFFRYMGMACGPLLGSFLLKLGGYNAVYGFTAFVFLGITFLLAKRFKIEESYAHK